MNGSPWGGSEELWYSMAIRLLKAGFRVTACVKNWGDRESPMVSCLREEGANIVYWQNSAAHLTGFEPGQARHGANHNFLSKFRSFRKKSQKTDDFTFSLSRLRPDLLFFNQGGTFDVAQNSDFLDFIKDPYCPYILMAQFNRDFGFSLSKQSFQAARLCFENSSAAWFVSERNKSSAERQLAMNLPQATVVQNPVNIDSGSKIEPMPDQTSVKFAQVARLDCRTKGQDVLFKVLSSKKWKSRDWTLNIYGEGPDRFFLEHLSRHLQIDERVTFHGHVKDIRAVWRDNHICLLPSIAEGTPLTLLEAMFCGRPAVVSDVGGNAEVITENRTGWVAECPSLKSFGNALDRAWTCREKWQSIGERAIVRAQEVHGTDPIGRSCDELMSYLQPPCSANT